MMDVKQLANMKPPMLETHPATWALLRRPQIYVSDVTTADLFEAALAENARWHFETNPLYRQWCQTIGDEAGEPPVVPAEIFKWHELGVGANAVLTVSSSGTGGRATTVPLDVETIIRMWAMGRAMFAAEGLISPAPVNYLIFAPDPAGNQRRGNPHFFHSLTAFAPAIETVYALQPAEDSAHRFAVADVVAALSRFAATGAPVRVIGLPALIAQAALHTPTGSVQLPPGSLVLTGGGWKQDAGASLSKPVFRALLQHAWGIPDDRVRDLYGMTESAVHFLECTAHHFHVPVFARVRIVDPLTLKPVAPWEWGVLHLENPGFTTLPALSLLTTDVGRDIGRCPCGRPGMAFEVAGRGGSTDFRGCAATTLASLEPSVPAPKPESPARPSRVIYQFGQWLDQDTTPTILTTILDQARHRQASMRALPLAKRCDWIGGLRQFWTSGGSFRKAYLLSRPERLLHLSSAMVERGLDTLVGYLDSAVARRRLERQLGNIESLDEKTEPIGTILHVVTGNIFIGPVQSLLAGLLTRNINLVKVPSHARTFLTAFIQTLELVAPELASAVALLEWPGGDTEVERVLLQGVDGVIVAAGPEAVSAYQRMASPEKRVVEFGPRVSVAVIADKDLTDQDADRLALDVGLWDQFACTAAQCVFVKGRAAAETVAKQLAAALERLASIVPEGEASLDEKITIARMRQRARFDAAVLDHRLWTAIAGLWTVVFDSVPSFQFSPLRRCVRVMPYANESELVDALQPVASLLQTVGLHADAAEATPITDQLAALGARRFCRLGQMNQPAPDEPHDGTLELQHLVRGGALPASYEPGTRL